MTYASREEAWASAIDRDIARCIADCDEITKPDVRAICERYKISPTSVYKHLRSRGLRVAGMPR
jgi:hypothetical protein